jgi:hypothetical protein
LVFSSPDSRDNAKKKNHQNCRKQKIKSHGSLSLNNKRINQSKKKDISYSPQGVPWKAAGTAEMTCCPADRAEKKSPPPPPRPAPRLHAAEKQQVK